MAIKILKILKIILVNHVISHPKMRSSAHTKRAVFVPSDVKITGHPGLRWQAITSATFTSWEYPSAPQCPHQCHTSGWPCGHGACRSPQLHPYLQSTGEAQGGFHSAFGTCIPGIPLGKKHHVHNLGRAQTNSQIQETTHEMNGISNGYQRQQAEKYSRPANIMMDFFPPGCSPEHRKTFQCENETIHSEKHKEKTRKESFRYLKIHVHDEQIINISIWKSDETDWEGATKGLRGTRMHKYSMGSIHEPWTISRIFIQKIFYTWYSVAVSLEMAPLCVKPGHWESWWRPELDHPQWPSSPCLCCAWPLHLRWPTCLANSLKKDDCWLWLLKALSQKCSQQTCKTSFSMIPSWHISKISAATQRNGLESTWCRQKCHQLNCWFFLWVASSWSLAIPTCAVSDPIYDLLSKDHV